MRYFYLQRRPRPESGYSKGAVRRGETELMAANFAYALLHTLSGDRCINHNGDVRQLRAAARRAGAREITLADHCPSGAEMYLPWGRSRKR